MAAAATGWAIGAALCFAAALVLTEFGLRHLSPLLGAAVSIPAATVLFWLLAPVMLDTSAASVEALAVFAAVGLLFPVAVTLLTFESNRRMGANLTGTLGNLAPAFAVAFAVLILGERPDGAQLAAVAAIVAGACLLTWRPRRSVPAWPLWAMAIPLCGAALRGLWQSAVKIGLDLWPNPFAATLIGYTVSSLVILAVVGLFARPQPGRLKSAGLAWFAAVGLANGLAVFSLYRALAVESVSLVAPVVASYPLFTLALGAALLRRQHVDARQAASIAVIVAGVALLLAG